MDSRKLLNWATHEFACHAAKIAVTTFEAAGIQVLPVKGLLLARQLYDFAHRPIADVDLIIRRKDFRDAIRLAHREGWQMVWDAKVLGAVNFVIEGIPFDVKSSFGPPGLAATSVSAILARAKRCERPLGFEHSQIELHDHALLLAIDAFKDKLGTGKPWACEDLVRFAKLDGFSAVTLLERAESADLRTMLAIVADWVLSKESSSGWASVADQLRGFKVRRRFVEQYRRQLLDPGQTRWTRWYLSAKTRAVSDSVPRRALALALGTIGTLRFLLRHGTTRAQVWRARSSPSR